MATKTTQNIRRDWRVLEEDFSEQIYRFLNALKLSEVTMDFGSIAANAEASLAPAVVGMVAGDVVLSLTPSAPLEALYFRRVTPGAAIVTVIARNETAGAIDAASAVYTVCWLDVSEIDTLNALP